MTSILVKADDVRSGIKHNAFTLSWPVTASMGINGLRSVFKHFRNQSLQEHLDSDSNADAVCSVCTTFQKAGKSLNYKIHKIIRCCP